MGPTHEHHDSYGWSVGNLIATEGENSDTTPGIVEKRAARRYS